MSAIADIYDIRTLRDAVRLARVVVRPFDIVDDARIDMSALDARRGRVLAGHPSFRGPMNRVLARSLGLTTLPLGEAHLRRLGLTAKAQLALLLISADMAQVRQAAMLLAGAILHRRAVKIVLKPQRARLAAALGDDALALATREAPMLHASLGDLEAGDGFDRLMADDTVIEEARAMVIGTGLAGCLRFLDHAEPDVSPVFRLRLRPDEAAMMETLEVTPFTELHGDQMVRLMQRRMEPWRPFIA